MSVFLLVVPVLPAISKFKSFNFFAVPLFVAPSKIDVIWYAVCGEKICLKLSLIFGTSSLKKDIFLQFSQYLSSVLKIVLPSLS